MFRDFTVRWVTWSVAVVFGLWGLSARAEPLTTTGIGLASCAKLAQDMNPTQGLNNTVNVLVYYWVQGYMSAANIHLLDDNSEYVDLGAFDEKKILPMVFDFCKENPDKKPISAIDKFIRKSPKVSGDWKSGTIKWSDD
jgi:hypothetical protein